jgi:predicted metal-dependent peptidase
MAVLPGRRGFGAHNVAVAIDTSGSIGEKQLSAFFAEVGGVLQDVHPRKIYLIWCDAMVHRVDECSSLDELAHIRAQGAPGGGGTSFIPPFEWLADNDVRPECMIYLTDMYGDFPKEAPAYPVIWCAITDADAPWGEVVRIKV